MKIKIEKTGKNNIIDTIVSVIDDDGKEFRNTFKDFINLCGLLDNRLKKIPCYKSCWTGFGAVTVEFKSGYTIQYNKNICVDIDTGNIEKELIKGIKKIKEIEKKVKEDCATKNIYIRTLEDF